jgi:hypothetical protein
LTGSNSTLSPVHLSTCNLTTGPSYNVALAESEFFRSDTYVGYVSSFIFGVTPVLTVFYPNIGQVVPANLEQAEAHLTCLKIVEPGASDSGSAGLVKFCFVLVQYSAYVGGGGSIALHSPCLALRTLGKTMQLLPDCNFFF